MQESNDHPMNLEEAAAYARMSKRSIQHHTALGNLRAYRHAGAARWHRWYKSDVDAFLKAESTLEAS